MPIHYVHCTTRYRIPAIILLYSISIRIVIVKYYCVRDIKIIIIFIKSHTTNNHLWKIHNNTFLLVSQYNGRPFCILVNCDLEVSYSMSKLLYFNAF